MREIKPKELTAESFAVYGTFVRMVNPDGLRIGAEPIEFFRDLGQLFVGQPVASFSTCRVLARPFVVDTTEIHRGCGEGILPLDEDVLIHVGPAAPNGEVPLDRFECFRVPKGTFVALKRGVFHHAPFALGACANVLIVLPERTYADDCEVYEIPEDKRLTILA